MDELFTELNRLDLFNQFSFNQSDLSLSEPIHSSLNIIIGVDFTASNEWQGRKTFNSQSLHKTLGNKIYNPYQKVISTLGFVLNKLIHTTNSSNLQNALNNSLSSSNSSNYLFNKSTNSTFKVYAYGFGDSKTTDQSVFSFFDTFNSNRPNVSNVNNLNYAESFDEILTR